MVRPLMKSFWKTLAVDIVLLGFLFVTGVVVKTKLALFFHVLDDYQAQAMLLESGLSNQSMDALVQFEQVVGRMDSLVTATLFIVVIVVPLLLYLSIVLSQSLQISFLRGVVEKKYFLKTFLLGLPILIFVLLAGDWMLNSFTELLTSTSAMYLALFFAIVIFVVGYLWYVFALILYGGTLRKHFSLVYKKLHVLFPLFLLYLFFYFTLLGLIGWLAIRYLTESFVSSELVFVLGAMLIVLVLQQIVRYIFVKQVAKAQS